MTYSNTDPLFSAKLKVQWAARHLKELQAEIQRFLATDFCSISMEKNLGSGNYLLDVGMKSEFPADILLLVGDVIHNLRSALDHAATGIVGTAEEVYFPFHRDVDQFKTCPKVAAINKAVPGLGDHIVSDLKPHSAGDYLLWALTKVDAIDKHRFIMPSVAITRVRFVAVNRKSNVRIDVDAEVQPGGIAKIAETSIPLEIEGKAHGSFDVRFGQGTFLEDKSVFPTLLNLGKVTAKALDSIERFIADSKTPAPATA